MVKSQYDQDAIKKYLPPSDLDSIPEVRHATQWEAPKETANYNLKFLAGQSVK